VNPIGRLGSLANPIQDAILLENGHLGMRIVTAEHFNMAMPRSLGLLLKDDAELGLVSLAEAVEADGLALRVDSGPVGVVEQDGLAHEVLRGDDAAVDETSHDPTDRLKAMALAFATDKMPLGVIYQNPSREPYESLSCSSDIPLYKQEFDEQAFSSLLKSFA
jgi:hypothetical protein